MNHSTPLFDLDARNLSLVPAGLKPLYNASVKPLLDKLLSLDRFYETYQAVAGSQGEGFIHASLDHLGIQYDALESDLKRIPSKGGLLVVANHTFGIVDPLILLSLLLKRRSDVKIITNRWLASIPELSPLCIFVDPFGGQEAVRNNIAAAKEILRWLREGHVAAVFPAGEVASFNLQKMRIFEADWSTNVARFLRLGNAAALPVYFSGANSLLFHLSGLLHPRLRTALLPRETLNKHRMAHRVTIGNPITHEKLNSFEDDSSLVDYLKRRTMLLRHRFKKIRQVFRVARPQDQAPIIEPVPAERLASELSSLPEDQMLLKVGPVAVYCAEAAQIPQTLTEIGRLREITFREVGEGSGLARDLDDFDRHYSHIFLWHTQNREIIGAYRLGRTDRILALKGRRGLYTSTLFNLSRRLLSEVSPALELGRSWVRKEYQRSSISLALLWKGIGAFVVKHPQYRFLFGPVSFSNEYSTVSHRLMVQFLRRNLSNPELTHEVRSIHPFKKRMPTDFKRNRNLKALAVSIDDVSDLVSDLERDGKGVPVLVKEYVKLGGRMLGFNIDKDFSNVIDGLILVDLTQTAPKILERYLGKEGAPVFQAYHGLLAETTANDCMVIGA